MIEADPPPSPITLEQFYTIPDEGSNSQLFEAVIAAAGLVPGEKDPEALSKSPDAKWATAVLNAIDKTIKSGDLSGSTPPVPVSVDGVQYTVSFTGESSRAAAVLSLDGITIGYKDGDQDRLVPGITPDLILAAGVVGFGEKDTPQHPFIQLLNHVRARSWKT